MSQYWKTVFANDNDALVPEIWAQEALMILEANMVAANLVYRDFENEIAQYGDTVNAHRPGTFTAKRKVDGDNVTVQDATATNVPVKLDQHLHVSFLIYDGEESKSFKDLVELYLRPALIAQAMGLDQVVLGQVYEFLGNTVGKLGTDPDADTVIAANEVMNTNRAPVVGRNMIVTPNAEGALLSETEFTKVNESGDTAGLRDARLGRKFNFDFFMSQNCPSVAVGSTINAAGDINAGNLTIGSTVLTMHGITGTYTPLAGMWCTIAGDMTPQLITSVTGGSTPTSITITPGLRHDIADGAIITFYTNGVINQAVSPTGYALGWNKNIVHTGPAVAPKTGQLISMGVDGYKYAAMSTPTTTQTLLNRSLDAAVANAAVMGIGPAGEYCFGFHRNAMALVVRPLAAPRAGTGALSYVANYNGLSVRVTITYDGNAQGHLVTVDLLAGVKTLDTNLGVIMFA